MDNFISCRKRIIFCLILALSAFSNAFASLDSGFTIRYKNFEITCRYHEANPAIGHSDFLDIFSPDKLMWELLSWVYYNKEILDSYNGSYTFYFDADKGTTGSYYTYFSFDAGSNYDNYIYRSERDFFAALNSILQLDTKIPDDSIQIPMIMIYTDNYLYNQRLTSAVYSGALPGSMYTKFGYPLFFWDKKGFNSYIKKCKPGGYSFKKIILTRETSTTYLQ